MYYYEFKSCGDDLTKITFKNIGRGVVARNVMPRGPCLASAAEGKIRLARKTLAFLYVYMSQSATSRRSNTPTASPTHLLWYRTNRRVLSSHSKVHRGRQIPATREKGLDEGRERPLSVCNHWQEGVSKGWGQASSLCIWGLGKASQPVSG